MKWLYVNENKLSKHFLIDTKQVYIYMYSCLSYVYCLWKHTKVWYVCKGIPPILDILLKLQNAQDNE